MKELGDSENLTLAIARRLYREEGTSNDNLNAVLENRVNEDLNTVPENTDIADDAYDDNDIINDLNKVKQFLESG